MAAPESDEDKAQINKLYDMASPYKGEIDNFPKNLQDFSALSAADLSNMQYDIQFSIPGGYTIAGKLVNDVVDRKEKQEQQLLHSALGLEEDISIDRLSPDDLNKLSDKAIEKAKAAKNPEHAEEINKLTANVFEMRKDRQDSIAPGEKPKKVEFIKYNFDQEEPAPTKETNRLTYDDAMALKNESIREKNAEQSAADNEANKVKGVGRILYGATLAMPVEGIKI